MSEMLGPDQEDLGVEPENVSSDELTVSAEVTEMIDDERPLEVDEVALGPITPVPSKEDLFPINRTEAAPGMDLERSRLIDKFFLEKATFLEATNHGSNIISKGMVCLNKDSSKSPRYGRMSEIVHVPDSEYGGHAQPKFTLEYNDGEHGLVRNPKPVYELNKKELADLPEDYRAQLTVAYETGDLTIGQYVKVKEVADFVGRVAFHLDQEAFPGKIGLVLRDATISQAHLVAVSLEDIEIHN